MFLQKKTTKLNDSFSIWMLISTAFSRSRIWSFATNNLKYPMSTSWTIFIIVFSQLNATLLKFLSCRCSMLPSQFFVKHCVRKVNDEWYLWYDGTYQCLGPVFYIITVVFFIGILIPIVVFYWLYLKPPFKRMHQNFIPLTGNYKYKYWDVLSESLIPKIVIFL